MFFCKSENWLDPRDTHWDEASSLTPSPRTAWRAAFLFNRHQHGQPFSWEWVRQGSWWRWSPLRLAPRSRSRDSIRESAQHCGGEERGQPSLIYYTLSSCYSSHRPASYLLNEIQHLFLIPKVLLSYKIWCTLKHFLPFDKHKVKKSLITRQKKKKNRQRHDSNLTTY